MDISKCKLKTKCDIGGCKNLAVHSFEKNGKQILNLCSECEKEILNTLSTLFTPKSIPAPFKKLKKVED